MQGGHQTSLIANNKEMYHLEGSAVGVRMRREMDDGSRGCLLQAIWVGPQLRKVRKE